jgi:hypothetical protein
MWMFIVCIVGPSIAVLFWYLDGYFATRASWITLPDREEHPLPIWLEQWLFNLPCSYSSIFQDKADEFIDQRLVSILAKPEGHRTTDVYSRKWNTREGPDWHRGLLRNRLTEYGSERAILRLAISARPQKSTIKFNSEIGSIEWHMFGMNRGDGYLRLTMRARRFRPMDHFLF